MKHQKTNVGIGKELYFKVGDAIVCKACIQEVI